MPPCRGQREHTLLALAIFERGNLLSLCFADWLANPAKSCLNRLGLFYLPSVHGHSPQSVDQNTTPWRYLGPVWRFAPADCVPYSLDSLPPVHADLIPRSLSVAE